MNDASFTEPSLFGKLSDTYHILHTRIGSFPKVSRYSLGMRLEHTLLEFVELGYLARSKRGRSQLLILEKMDVKLRIFFFHLRIAHRTRCINDAGYAELSELGVEIGRMLGGWIKKTKKDMEANTANESR